MSTAHLKGFDTLTEKQQKALQIFYKDRGRKPFRDCILEAGYTPQRVREVTVRLKEYIIELTEIILADSGPKAAHTILDLMNSTSTVPQASIKLDAAKTLLDRIGVVKRDKIDISHEHSGGVFLIPAKEA